MDFELTYRRFSERSILIEWPHEIDQFILNNVLAFKNQLLNSSFKSIVQINHAYNSMLIIYDDTIDNVNDEILALNEVYSAGVSIKNSVLRHWKIPVCYDAEFGLDLDEISKVNNLPKSEVIKLHSGTIYRVFFIGFLPGFLYLGGLNERLYFPRKKSPRAIVKKGSVAIGGMQTGIYPNQSPAGWQIIGNSPLEFFNANAIDPCFAKSGDKIEFVPVSKAEHQYILNAIENNTYKIKSEIFHD